jgi:KDO2-lipid IV(A) lauroyltransferase
MPDARGPGVAFRVANLLAAATPGFVAHAAALSLGGVGALAMRDERRMVERHQRRVSPNLNALQMQRRINDAFQSYLRYYVETFRVASLSAREIEAGFSVEGFHHIEAAHAAGKGVILAVPHVGGWEWAGRWIVQRGYKMSAVVEVLDNKEAYEAFTDVRRAMGVDVIPLDDRAGVAVQEALRAGHVVSLMADRDIQRNGVPVEFFGEQTTAPAGPAFFSLRVGAPIVPLAVYFTRRVDGHHAVVRPPLALATRGALRDDIARLTQQMITEFETLIRRAPEQWHLFSPNWPSDPGYSR